MFLLVVAVAALPTMDPVAYWWCAPPDGSCPLLVTAEGRALCCFSSEPTPAVVASCAPIGRAGDAACNTVVTANNRAMAWCCQDTLSTTTSWPADIPRRFED